MNLAVPLWFMSKHSTTLELLGESKVAGMLRLREHVPWEGGWDAGVGTSSFIQPNSKIPI
jgi:hypothetical protein